MFCVCLWVGGGGVLASLCVRVLLLLLFVFCFVSVLYKKKKFLFVCFWGYKSFVVLSIVSRPLPHPSLHPPPHPTPSSSFSQLLVCNWDECIIIYIMPSDFKLLFLTHSQWCIILINFSPKRTSAYLGYSCVYIYIYIYIYLSLIHI